MHVVALLGAAVIAVPVFKRAGLGSVLGYLAAGLIIGPFGLRLFTDPQAILHVAELGVVMFLFVIGLEMQPSRLWSLRREIFGLGVAQVSVCGALLTGVGVLAGLSPVVAFVAAMGFVLSSTAIVAQILDERGDTATPAGQRVVSILLLEDLAIVPLLVLVALLAPAGPQVTASGRWVAVAIALAAIAALIAAGRWLLNPFFRILADAHAREVMTAAALFVVLGAALAMQVSGLSMAMGAFLAGVLLSESTFRHQLEADIEPFRGILLGLFFMSVGMSIDVAIVRQHWLSLLLATMAVIVVKAVIVFLLFRGFRSPWRDAARAGALLAPAGEFAFVLLPLGVGFAALTPRAGQFLTALAALTMFIGPLAAKALDQALNRITEPPPEPDLEALEGSQGRVIVIGFGRFGQVVNQVLLAQSFDVTVIDNNVDRIRSAAGFGFQVYYGDGTRLDVLRAAGAGRTDLVCICIDDREAALEIVEILHEEFPQARSYVRAYDRIHAIDLMNLDVDYQIRETFESALAFGQATIEELGVDAATAKAVVDDVRRRDIARLMMQKVEGLMGGVDMLHGTRLEPQPLTDPRKRAHGLSEETRDLIGEDDAVR
jgi:monovalent cation:proton antiporter-2 (CPA2) family protein